MKAIVIYAYNAMLGIYKNNSIIACIIEGASINIKKNKSDTQENFFYSISKSFLSVVMEVRMMTIIELSANNKGAQRN